MKESLGGGGFLNGGGVGGLLYGAMGFNNVLNTVFKDDAVLSSLDFKKSMFNKGSKAGLGGDPLGLMQRLYMQFLTSASDIREVYAKIETIRQQYIVKGVISCLVDDAMAPDPTTGQVFNMTISDDYSRSEEAQKALEEFEEKFKLDRLVSNAIEDAIFYGEYLYEIEGVKGKGVTKIIDSSPPGSVFAIYSGVDPKSYIRINRKDLVKGGQMTLEQVDKGRYWHMNLFPAKFRFSLDPLNNPSANSHQQQRNQLGLSDLNLDHYLRVGEPYFLSVYDKVLELEAFEKGQVAKDFADLHRKSIVGVQAPEGLELKQISTFIEYYQGLLNADSNEGDIYKYQGLDQVRQSTADLGKLRVIPIQPSRGGMDLIDTRNSTADSATENITDRRNIITSTLGVPTEYVFGERDGNPTSIRQFVRYSRKTQQIQSGVGTSLKQLSRAHLVNLGFEDIIEDDINVTFHNVTNVAELDRLELMDTNIGLMENMNNFVDALAEDETTSQYINKVEKLRFIQSVFMNIQGAENIIQIPEDAGTEDKETDTEKESMTESITTIPRNYTHPLMEQAQGIQIYSFLRKYFKRKNASIERWSDIAKSRFPDVDSAILVDIKNDVLKEFGEGFKEILKQTRVPAKELFFPEDLVLEDTAPNIESSKCLQ